MGKGIPATPAVYKLSSNGSTVYSVSSINGTPIGSSDPFTSVAIDAQGNCYLFGVGNNIPATPGAFQSQQKGNNPMVVKLDGSGNVVYATYIGGSGSDSAYGMAVDSAGNVYLTGSTTSNDFPTKNPFQAIYGGNEDAFIAVLNSTGTGLIYSTYWGGSDLDVGLSIAVDSSQNIYIAGQTNSSDFPTVSPFQPTNASTFSGFVIKLNLSGVPVAVYSTYLGGSNGAIATSIAADALGSAYVAGSAYWGFPLVNPIQSSVNDSVFLSKFNPTGSALAYSTYLGTFTAIGYYASVAGIAVDSGGQAYIAGSVQMPYGSIPVASPTQSSFDSSVGPYSQPTDGFISVMNNSGTALSFSTLVGGSFDEAGGLGVDSLGNMYITGISYGPLPIQTTNDGTYLPNPSGTATGIAWPQLFALKISPSPGTSLSFPQVADLRSFPTAVGSSLPPAILLLANANATGNIAISNIAISGDFSQASDCPASLLAAASCHIHVTFTPTAGGPRAGSITVTDSAPGSPHIISLLGTGLIPQFTPAPTSLTFPSQPVGTTSQAQNVTLTNTGGAGFSISSVTVTGDFSEQNNCPPQLGPSGSCQVSVTFAPTSTGSRTGLLTMVDTAPGSPHSVALSGTGASPSVGLAVLAGGSTSATVAAGGTASYTLSIGGAGMSGTASITCSGAPQGANCNLPATATVNATTPGDFNVQVTTTSRSTATVKTPTHWLWSVAVLVCLILPLSEVRKRWYWRWLPIATLILSSCGGSNGVRQNPNGTPAGNYMLTVTATLPNSTQNVALTLNVN